ncbi:MAG: hypothetical protein WED34_07880 [Planctomycetales bacterium]
MLHPIARSFAVLSMAVTFAATLRAAEQPDSVDATAKSDEPAKPAETVRRLTAKSPVDPLRSSGSRVISDAAALEQFAGKQVAEELKKQIDFDKEIVAAFGFMTSGPPFGTPQGEVKKEGEKQWVEFRVEEPNVAVRGQAAQIGMAFFALPKGTEVKFPGAGRNQPPQRKLPTTRPQTLRR